ncbi:S4 domain-containing protein YaaA [Lentilactobacillus parafarraginis]|jgi:S4 domain protein YaaA|uniref:S4 domain-containing protein YaaA n=1 Tax=Lentilactobacillus parafarraginis TaxID=390842 RepID=UPI001486ACF0
MAYNRLCKKVGEIVKKEIFIDGPYITLGQLLKEESVISSGGQAKWYLRENTVNVNDEPDNRRGRKLYPGDNVAVPDVGLFFIRSKRDDK